MVGGLDVGAGIFGLLVVKAQTHNELYAALAFTIGFVSLTLAHSELFTEDFMRTPHRAQARPGTVETRGRRG